jgi:hypothetical protein
MLIIESSFACVPSTATVDNNNLSLYHLGGRQGDSKQNNNVLCTHFDGQFDGHLDVAVLYRAHRPMEKVQGFHKSH